MGTGGVLGGIDPPHQLIFQYTPHDGPVLTPPPQSDKLTIVQFEKNVKPKIFGAFGAFNEVFILRCLCSTTKIFGRLRRLK